MNTLGSAIKKFECAGVLAGALAAAGLGLAGTAAAAPSGPGNAQETISLLEAQGNKVIVNKLGNAPIEETNAVKVRTGQTYSRSDSGFPGNARPLGTVVLRKTIYVDVQ